MAVRHRDIAASPVRSAQETWITITELLTDTLERSSDINVGEVERTLDALTPAAVALVAPGHFEREPLTLRAEPLRLTIGTVSGERAFRAFEEENLNPVPGGASATHWVMHIPRPVALVPLIDSVVANLDHVSTNPPPDESAAKSESNHKLAIDLKRLKSRS